MFIDHLLAKQDFYAFAYPECYQRKAGDASSTQDTHQT